MKTAKLVTYLFLGYFSMGAGQCTEWDDYQVDACELSHDVRLVLDDLQALEEYFLEEKNAGTPLPEDEVDRLLASLSSQLRVSKGNAKLMDDLRLYACRAEIRDMKKPTAGYKDDLEFAPRTEHRVLRACVNGEVHRNGALWGDYENEWIDERLETDFFGMILGYVHHKMRDLELLTEECVPGNVVVKEDGHTARVVHSDCATTKLVENPLKKDIERLRDSLWYESHSNPAAMIALIERIKANGHKVFTEELGCGADEAFTLMMKRLQGPAGSPARGVFDPLSKELPREGSYERHVPATGSSGSVAI